MLVAVPCSGADCVALFDAETGAERGRFAVGSHPVHLALAEGRVFVATMGDRAISAVVDGEVTRVETGVLGPSHFALTDGGTLLVPCTGGDALALVDAAALELRGRVGVGAEPHDVALLDGLAFVGSRGDGAVTVVDPATATVVDEFAVGEDARVQGVEAGAVAAYAVDQRNAALVRLTADGVTDAIPVGENPYDAVRFDGRLHVAGRDDGTVTVTDESLSDREVHRPGGRPVDVVGADGAAWVVDRERPVLRSLDGREVSLPFPAFVARRVRAADDRVVASHYDDDAVSLVDLAADEVAWTASTPSRPFDPLAV